MFIYKLIIAIYILSSIPIAFNANRNGRSFMLAMTFSLLFTPLVGSAYAKFKRFGY